MAKKNEEVEPQKLDATTVRQLRAAAAPAPRRITQKFALMGGVTVTIKGPEGAARWQSTHDSVVISTGDKELAGIALERRTKPTPRPVHREMSGDPNEPGGTFADSLPGDDEIAEANGRKIEEATFDFLKQEEKRVMRKAAEE